MKWFVILVTFFLLISSDIQAKIPRSQSAKHEFWRQSGHPNGWAGHVVDHINPLACGGADIPSNMQWQTIDQGKVKDRIELRGSKCHRSR